MEIILLSVGKINTPWVKEALSLYENRISKYVKFKSLTIPDIKNTKSLTVTQIKEAEGNLILTEFTDSDFIVLLDEKGKESTSRDFAKWFEKQMASGKKRIVFVIGGPFGFSEEVYSRANYKFSLSKLTFTHEMAKMFFTEQIYRAFTILNNEPYHHD